MTTDNMFQAVPPANQQPNGDSNPNVNSQNPFATLLSGIKNEHGAQKFQSPEDLAKGYLASQEFINTLKREKEEAQRIADEAARKVQELSGSLSSQDELRRTVEQLTQRINDKPATADSTLDPAKIAELVEQSIAANQSKASAKQNQEAVVAALVAKYGDKAEEVYNRAAAEVGMSVAEANALAAKAPKAVLKALGLDQVAQQQSFGPKGSVVNTVALAPSENSFVGRNKTILDIGATTADLNKEARNARAMVDEIHAAGLTIDDLTKPSVYNKYFGN